MTIHTDVIVLPAVTVATKLPPFRQKTKWWTTYSGFWTYFTRPPKTT